MLTTLPPRLLQDTGFNQAMVQSKDPDALRILERLPSHGLAVVGTRYPRTTSLKWMESEFKKLQGTDIIIISGLAKGIDQQAHEMALNQGLPTLAVIAAGLDILYPKETLHLRKKILDAGGLVISPYPLKTPAYPGQFLARNRLIAALAAGTWMVEGSKYSGSVNTALHTLELQRKLWVTPAHPTDGNFAGNTRLLEEAPGVIPFFGTHSLGCEWIALATRFISQQISPARDSELTGIPQLTPANLFLFWLQSRVGPQIPVSVVDLFEQVRERDVPSETFYAALDHALREEKILINEWGQVSWEDSATVRKPDLR